MTEPPQDEALMSRRRKALFRAYRRGFKEVELVFSTFAEAEAMTLAADDLAAFEALLDVPDMDVYAWLVGFQTIPSAFDTPVFARMRRLCNRKEPTWIA